MNLTPHPPHTHQPAQKPKSVGLHKKKKLKKELEKSTHKNIRINSAGCLDFCEQGPTVVIYPESVWYSIKNPEKDIPEIVKEHLINGNIVKRCLIEL